MRAKHPPKTSSDADLLKRARKDADAYQEFYGRHCTAIDAWLRKQTGNADVAAELTAETFAQAWFGLKRFKGKEDGDGIRWVFGIARNLSREYFRRSRVERSAQRKLSVDVEAALVESDPHDEIVSSMTQPELLAAIERLPEHERHALMLRVVSQMSFREVAGKLDCTENAARLRVSRALGSLRAQLREGCALEAVVPARGGVTDERV